ncbi:MAG: dihydrodipicolinate synthase family protein [Phycisphaerae bacterium]|nr:dihydrodipicolinate synthase family protein [Phycisphaerae bacterium]
MCSQPTTHFTGIWPAMITPFDDNDELDLKALDKLVAHLIKEGASGLYVGGSTGEGPLMSPDERKTLAERTVAAVAGQIPVIVHVGGGRPADDIALAKHASKLGVAGVSSVPPIYYPYPPESVFEHFRRIAAAAEVPFYGYHLTGQSARPLSMEQYVECLLEIPTAAGIKYTGQNPVDIAMLRQLSDGKLMVFSGADECYLGNMAQGAEAAIGSFYNVFLPEWRKMHDLAVGGKWDEARHRMALAAHAIMEIRGFGVDLAKYILAKQGFNVGCARHPLPRMDRPTHEPFEKIWATLGEFRANVQNW